MYGDLILEHNVLNKEPFGHPDAEGWITARGMRPVFLCRSYFDAPEKFCISIITVSHRARLYGRKGLQTHFSPASRTKIMKEMATALHILVQGSGCCDGY